MVSPLLTSRASSKLTSPSAGEGPRHADNPQYYKLIVVHAVFMASPFLFLIPAAIFAHRFRRHETPRQAIQWHFILNSISLLSLTVGFAAGWFAVNKGEWADNPHHIIGVTLYAGMMIQAAFGLIVRGSERKKIRKLGQVGLKAMVSYHPPSVESEDSSKCGCDIMNTG